jgi:hypothetical protein
VSDSLSKIPIRVTVVDRGEARGVLNRLTAPLTVEDIMKRLPMNTRTSPAAGFVSIIIGIRRGTEKPVTRVQAGTMGYWPRGDALCIYTGDTATQGPVNRVGEIREGLELFQGLRSGSRIIIERA